MIHVEVEVVCDWCGLREPVSLQPPHCHSREWEAVIGEDKDRPCWLEDAIETLGWALVASAKTLCPTCRQQVAWTQDLTLRVIEEEDEAE